MKVFQALGLAARDRKTGPMIGIECETEGRRLQTLGSDFWRTEADGSLRDGLEYVSRPLEPKEVKQALKSLNDWHEANKSHPNFSFRCSTHIHINVQDLEEQQLFSMIFLYMMYENVFMNYVHKERVGNRFCLRFQDAQALTYEVSNLLRRTKEENLKYGLRGLQQNTLKYAALNLYTLNKYGTLEFRALEGSKGVEHIDTWVQAIIRLRSVAMKFDSTEKLYEVFVADPEELANEIFGHAPDKFLLPGWKEQVEEGYSQNQAILMDL